MKISLISGQELTDDLAGVWARLQEANLDLFSPYFHPEFTKAIAAVRPDVKVGVFELDGMIAAFFPFQHENSTIGWPVGGVISDYHGAISLPNFRFSPRELLQKVGLAVWNFDHLPATQVSFGPFESSVEMSPQIDLSNGYDAYVRQRRSSGSEQIKKIYNLMRRMEREIGPLRFVAEFTDFAGLSAVLGWKSLQYRQSRKPDLFAIDWVRDSLERIFATRVSGFSGVLSLLYAGNNLVAGHLGMRSQRTLHYWFPSYDPAASKYSPGSILLLKMAEHAPTSGISIIDLGKGMSPYKERLMNSSSLLASGSIELPSWRSFYRKTSKMVRSGVARSPFGASARVALEWLRRRDNAVR